MIRSNLSLHRNSLVSSLPGAAPWVGVGVLAVSLVGAEAPVDTPRSSPKDTTPYVRPLTSEERNQATMGAALDPFVTLVDVIVSNTDPTLNPNDTFNDGETSIAINPTNPDEIVITAFSGGWGATAPLFHSTDGGLTWTKRNTISFPPGGNGGPNDQTVDFGLSGLLYGVFLSCAPGSQCDCYTGSSANPASAAAWSWALDGTGNALITQLHANAVTNSDQPWLLVNRDPSTASQENAYVGYDDFSENPVEMRVAVSYGTAPPASTVDNPTGFGGSGINPGHRLAVDPRTGFVYSLFQQCVGNCNGDPKSVETRINRSRDGGVTWDGVVVVDTTLSTQPTPKFGTVNALLGGVHHAGIDPVTGEIYHVYGDQDGGGNDRLAIRRISTDAGGNLVVGPKSFVTGAVEAAIPVVAVMQNGIVGVFYYTFDGFSSDSFPIFTAHLAFSADRGATFTDKKLLTFLSSAKDCNLFPSFCQAGADPQRQRVLGDYMQMKAVGNTFYGAFTANGVAFGRPFANHDPIFFKATIGPEIQVPGNVTLPDACVGASSTATLNVCNQGNSTLEISGITSSSGPFAVTTPSGGWPVKISPDFCFPFQVTFAPTSAGAKSATLTIRSNDSDDPSVTIQAAGHGTLPDIRVTGSTDFGNVCAETVAEKVIYVCNEGKCDLEVSGALFVPACLDFTLINSPFPSAVKPGECKPFTIRSTPTSCGPKSCNLRITSSDPDSPAINLAVTANTPCPDIDVPPDLAFDPEVIQTVGRCNSRLPFPISNKGQCNLTITAITIGGVNAGDYSLAGLPSFPIILQPGHLAGAGDLNVVFAPAVVDRDREATLTVTYISDPITGATTSVTRKLCGEGVYTGARVLVTHHGIPLAKVEKIHLQRINANRNKDRLDTQDQAADLPLVTVIPGPPCEAFQYHREYGTVSNQIQLLPGSFQVTVQAIINGKRQHKTVGLNVDTCDFNPTVVVDF